MTTKENMLGIEFLTRLKELGKYLLGMFGMLFLFIRETILLPLVFIAPIIKIFKRIHTYKKHKNEIDSLMLFFNELEHFNKGKTNE